MYAYRRMTPEQQKATVEVRRRRGFPLHKPPHPDLGRGWYFITAATFEHRQIFTAPRELTALELRILEAVRDGGLACAGWVVMPNHYHILLEAENTAKVGKVVGPVHGRSSRYANIRDDATGRQVWYKFTDRKIRSERHFWTCLHYIIMNPVKHRFAARAEEWSWSCFHELRAAHGAPWIEDLQREYPLREFGHGWDDF